jgi:hypothetical protein
MNGLRRKNMRRLFVFSVLALLCIGGIGDGIVVAADPVQEGYEIRTYDISNLMVRTGHDPAPGEFPLYPFMTRYEDLHEEGEWSWLGADRIGDIVHILLGDELFDHNGTRVEMGEQSLIVKAAASVHQRIEQVLAFLDRHLNRTVRMQVEVYTARKAFEWSAWDEETVKAAKADGSLKPLLNRSVEVRLGDLWQARDGVTTPILYDYEPEIAQASVICEPQVKKLFTGLKVALRPFLSPDGQGLLVGLYASASRLQIPLEERDIEYRGRIGTQESVENVHLSRTLSDPRIEFVSLGTVVSLIPGKTEAVSAAFPHGKGLGNIVIALTAELAPAPPPLDLGRGMVCECFHLGYEQAGQMEPFVSYWRAELDENDLETFALQSHDVFMKLPIGEVEENHGAMILFDETFTPELDWEYNDLDPIIVGTRVFTRSAPSFFERIRGMATDLVCPKPSVLHGELKFVVVRGSTVLNEAEAILEQGQLAGWVTVPLMRGGQAFSMGGLEGLMVEKYDVDVATSAAVPNILVRTYLDGAVICLNHEPATPGMNAKGSIKTRIIVNRQVGPVDSWNLGDQGGILGVIDRPTFNHGEIEGRFPCDGNAHLLGSLTRRSADTVNTIYVLGRVR